MENQQTNQDNKALWIFKNFKDTIDVLPKKYRGRAWELVINYAFDGEIDLSRENSLIQMAVKSLIPLIKLRGKGGSQNGISNNPSGKIKANVGANVGANIDLFLNNNNSNNNSNKKNNINELFNKWYSKYPKKVSKQKALQYFEKVIENVDFNTLMIGLDNYINYIEAKKIEDKYIKHPTTWLNQCCWNDEYRIETQVNKDVEFIRQLEAKSV